MQRLPSSDTFAVRGVVSRLIGRDAELTTMKGLLARAVEYGAPQVVTILGNQGTGKTRFVEEWARNVGAPVRVFRGAATATRYSAITALLRDRFGLTAPVDAAADADEATKDRFRETVQAVLGDRRVGEVVHFLGAFVGFRFQDSPFTRAFEDNPRQHDEIGRAILRRFFEVDAASSPLVLVVDDLHLADDDTLTLLEELGDGLAGSPVLLATLARPELIVRRPQWGRGHGDATRIDLRNLADIEAKQMLRSLLERCEKVPDELVGDAVEQTGGNPFFLEELVRVFLANGTIDTSKTPWKVDAARAAATDLPISVEEAISARIAALAPAERDLLEKGAIFGNVFWLSAVTSLTRIEKMLDADKGKTPPPPPVGWSEDEQKTKLGARIQSLVERDYVLQMALEDSSIGGDVEIVFKHNLERDLVAKMIDEGRRKRYHKIAAQWLEAKLAERPEAKNEEQLEYLAQLYEKGGESRRAAQSWLAAGDRARDRYANTAAVDFYKHALALLGWEDALLRMEALHNLGSVLVLVGRTDEAAVQFQEMLRLAWLLDHPSKGGAAHSRIGRIYRGRGEYDRALEHFKLAKELFDRAGDRRGLAGVLGDVGIVHWQRGAYPVALDHHRQSLAIRRGLGDRRSIALSLADIGRVYNDSGAFQPALEQFREALEIRREIGDRPGMVSSMCDLGSVHEADGKLEAALEIFSDALKLAREIGDRMGQTGVLWRLGAVELALGKTKPATDHLTVGLEIANGLGDKLGTVECSRRLAEVELIRPDFEKALGYAKRALEMAHKLGSRVHVGVAQRIAGEVCSATGSSEAEELFKSSIATLADVKNELELARSYRAFAAFREKGGLSAEAVMLRMRADDIFGRLRGAARGKSSEI